jgi:hypothetical protein
VSVNNPLRRRAIIVAGGAQTDDIWPAIQNNATLVYKALTFQGYTNDDIYFMSPASIPDVTKLPLLNTLSNMSYAITTWARQSTKDVVIYMTGNGGYGTFDINSSETLPASPLERLLSSMMPPIREAFSSTLYPLPARKEYSYPAHQAARHPILSLMETSPFPGSSGVIY